MPLDLTQFDAAIVDLDGTMVDTLGDFEVAVNRMLIDMALPMVSREFIEMSIGKGTEHLVRSVLDKVGADPSLSALAVASYRNHYDEVNGQRSIVFPGVIEGLRRMVEAGLRLACLTNKPTAFARPLLESKGLARYFVLAFGADAFPKRKPDPMPLVRICKALGTEPGRTLVIGDSTHDARAARAAGCPVALVNYGYNHGRPVEDDEPDAVVSKLDELFAPAVAKA